MSQSVLVLLIIAIALALFVTELIPLPATAMFVCVACYFTGAISAKEAFSAFGSTNVMIIAAMAIIGEAMFRRDFRIFIQHRVRRPADRPGSGHLYLYGLSQMQADVSYHFGVLLWRRHHYGWLQFHTVFKTVPGRDGEWADDDIF